jgi:hypothetical protein
MLTGSATSSGDHEPRHAQGAILRRVKPWHVGSVLGFVVFLPVLWFALAYAGLPRLWSHHEHKKIGQRREIVSYTAQDIPGDPINLLFKGDERSIICAFRKGGWYVADPVSVRTGLLIGGSVLFRRPYPQAPVSPLFVKDHRQTIAFEKAEGRSADKRHHVRLWHIGNYDWLGAATFDRGVGVSLFTLQVTHHIGPDVDAERDAAGKLIVANGGALIGAVSSRIVPNSWRRNGGGDRYRTDGQIKIYRVGEGGC